MAVRDVSSGRTGSARQFVEVPDLANGQLALGGILIREANSGTDEDPRTGPAVRQFRLGSTIEYEYPLYNGRADLEVQARVYRDGTEVWASKPAAVGSSQGNGRLDPGTVSQSGQYTLVVTASECGAAVVARQSIDFEIAGTAPSETAAVAPVEVPAPPPVPGTKVPADEDLLARIRERAAQQIARRPNYTCLEDIERHRMHDGCPNCESSDNLRLEVAEVSGNERFAWPGSREFEDKEVADLVTTGMIGNGDFAGASDVVFFSKFTSYTLAGEATRAGRRALRIDHIVPAAAQVFRLRSNDGEARVGFRGSFWVDAQTLDLVHLETHALDIPAALKISSAAMSIDYSSFPISGRDFLLPQMTELRMTMANGTETTNRTRFSACRQFQAESAIVFDPAAAQAKSPQPAAPLVELPPGLVVDARLAAPITIARSAAGDPIQALVMTDVKSKGKVIVPKGAVLNGRIRHLSDHWGPPGFGEATALSNFTVIGFDFSTVSFAGTQARFRAELTRYSGPIREPNGRLAPSETSINDKSWGSTAILAFKQRMTEIPKGFWMRWRTIR